MKMTKNDTKIKLVELLDSFNRDLSKYAGNPKFFVVDDNIELADHLIAHGVTVQKHGQWMPYLEEVEIYNTGGFTEKRQTGWICSNCKKGFTKFGHQKYCDNCGSRMDGEN